MLHTVSLLKPLRNLTNFDFTNFCLPVDHLIIRLLNVCLPGLDQINTSVVI